MKKNRGKLAVLTLQTAQELGKKKRKGSGGIPAGGAGGGKRPSVGADGTQYRTCAENRSPEGIVAVPEITIPGHTTPVTLAFRVDATRTSEMQRLERKWMQGGGKNVPRMQAARKHFRETLLEDATLVGCGENQARTIAPRTVLNRKDTDLRIDLQQPLVSGQTNVQYQIGNDSIAGVVVHQSVVTGDAISSVHVYEALLDTNHGSRNLQTILNIALGDRGFPVVFMEFDPFCTARMQGDPMEE